METNGNLNKTAYVPYNGEPLKEGEVLVPQLVDRNYARSIGAKGLRTWCRGGVYYTIMFIPVPAEQEQLAWQTFNADVNDLLNERLGPNRYARCLIPQTDGTSKACPKVCGDNHPPCAECPYKGLYEREDRTVLSLEQLEEFDFAPMENTPSAEDCAMLDILLEDLLKNLDSMNPAYGQIVRMGYQGYQTKEIIQALPLKKSQAYRTVADCRKAVEELLRK